MREKAPEVFKQIVKEAEKLDAEVPVVPHWRKATQDWQCSENTRFTSPQQFLTKRHLQVVDLIVNQQNKWNLTKKLCSIFVMILSK